NKDCLEFIIKVDADDECTIALVDELKKQFCIYAIISPRGRGYHDVASWVNQMASVAKGDWIFVFNDDSLMRTENWDLLVLK
ncbi:hypothetical protein LLG31_25710, partial [Klebsiella pneumoniae]|uniref:hypothetical protein n=1 Tax=Klebsiella pneumoniae TaxID=573 RepID=UPI001EE9A52B